jgi:hypothetical protein
VCWLEVRGVRGGRLKAAMEDAVFMVDREEAELDLASSSSRHLR